jgi:putative transposase
LDCGTIQVNDLSLFSDTIRYVGMQKALTDSQARRGLENWFHFYNTQRPHTTFDGRRPMDVYRQGQKAA